MAGFLTVCFSDWGAEVFRRGVMAIRDGRHTDQPIRRLLRNDEFEGVHYYRKPDPDFDTGFYTRCHRQLRRSVQPGDLLFFRTLWRRRPYLIGYFKIEAKLAEGDNPVCLANLEESRLIDFRLEITPRLILKIRPEAVLVPDRHFNHQVNQLLGRNYLRLSERATNYLVKRINST